MVDLLANTYNVSYQKQYRWSIRT